MCKFKVYELKIKANSNNWRIFFSLLSIKFNFNSIILYLTIVLFQQSAIVHVKACMIRHFGVLQLTP